MRREGTPCAWWGQHGVRILPASCPAPATRLCHLPCLLPRPRAGGGQVLPAAPLPSGVHGTPTLHPPQQPIGMAHCPHVPLPLPARPSWHGTPQIRSGAQQSCTGDCRVLRRGVTPPGMAAAPTLAALPWDRGLILVPGSCAVALPGHGGAQGNVAVWVEATWVEDECGWPARHGTSPTPCWDNAGGSSWVGGWCAWGMYRSVETCGLGVPMGVCHVSMSPHSLQTHASPN